METRSHWVMVAIVVGLLTMAAFGFTIWLMEARDSEGPTYEVQFREAVNGLSNGSLVELQGVPVGRVTDVRLEPQEPGLVVVRFVLIRDFQLHHGVSASINRSLINGTATINLEGNDSRAPVLAPLPGRSFPLVPPRNTGEASGDRDSTAIIQRTALGVDGISKKLDRSGQEKIARNLAGLAERSRNWAGDAENIAGKISGSSRIENASRSITSVAEGAEKLRRRLERSPAELRQSFTAPIEDAGRRADFFGRSLSQARPKARRLQDDVRQATQTLRSVRQPVQQVSETTQTIESGELQSSKMPEYRPKE